MKNIILCSTVFVLLVSIGCNNNKKEEHAGEADTVATKTGELNLPAPYATKSASNYCDVIGWQQGKTPIVPDGFTVVAYATGLVNPRTCT
jgi:hypothetical protein